MRWTAKESSQYLQSKEYVDTVLLPLVPVNFGSETKNSGNAHEFIQLITMQLEKQFKGRVLLMPAIPLLSDSTYDENFSLIQSWIKRLIDEEFQHIFFISTDQTIKNSIDSTNCEFIWLPSIPLEHLDEGYKQNLIQDQVQQLLKVFITKWNGIETTRKV